jgi:hypothetical protein
MKSHGGTIFSISIQSKVSHNPAILNWIAGMEMFVPIGTQKLGTAFPNMFGMVMLSDLPFLV